MTNEKDLRLNRLIKKERDSRVKWGFMWGILGAILWGMGYVPAVAVWKLPDFSMTSIFPEGNGLFLALVAIAFGAGIAKASVSVLFWAGGEGKLSDVPKAIKHWKISKVMLLATLVASPVGVAGYQLAVGTVGGSFAAAASLLFGAFAALIAKALYKEKITRKAAIGITLIIIGGIFVFNPFLLIADLSKTNSLIAIIGYIGGFAAALAWGLESVFVSRVSDFYDYCMSMTCRGVFDVLLWGFVCVPIAMLAFGSNAVISAMIHIYTQPAFWVWEILYALSIYSAYVGIYRSLPLIGAGRGSSVSALYVIPGFLALYIFMGDVIKWWILAGAAIAVMGTVYMYWDSGSELSEGTRAIDDTPSLSRKTTYVEEEF
ncbi:hypothetical protein [Methanococcoides sp. FTZ1]|uniref:hypothetical protein n=1 Tax=Methanococcoides sp. FTZ1 TaxID=3439061 RepID=UPI003F862CBB